ncbi:protein kinase domain protein [Ichthyophthirius multifiliis]|uniref:Aurora kinase n=1 Tax=Ichthyophthirius multifiliis TaxID=5932 RepID=G0QLP5_ICHMU|nr:protein kinase domain protein [Ichthyophthirius multifiliis]EGR33859.1 protein kinase domain protein [Ichthyophthirius multifiliis]|eukprot:XP_004039083.1 protein kinase domain protein [Ichthyophthirius multifiliis]
MYLYKQKNSIEKEYNFSFSNNIKQQKEQQLAINYLEKNLQKSIDKQKNLFVSSFEINQWSLDNFQIGKCIGRGRFGNVYMARHKQSNMLVAIKQINKKNLSESCMERQLEQEIKIQMFSNHPNILKMYGFFHDETKVYLILEFACHFDIYKELKKETLKRFTEEKTANYIRQISEGLIYLHSHEIIHRDIKPENILNIHGVLKISDFGWSVYTLQEKRMTFCGTLDYVSPEIVQGTDYDQKVDIWSIGILCYELLVGKPPFENKNIAQDFLEFPPFVSELARQFIQLLLVKEPILRISIEKVLNHPWIVKNTKNCLDDWDLKVSEECLYLLR